MAGARATDFAVRKVGFQPFFFAVKLDFWSLMHSSAAIEREKPQVLTQRQGGISLAAPAVPVFGRRDESDPEQRHAPIEQHPLIA